jgi:hypothetical protein
MTVLRVPREKHANLNAEPIAAVLCRSGKRGQLRTGISTPFFLMDRHNSGAWS